MQKIIIHQFGNPDVLSLETCDIPCPGPDEVLVQLKTIGVNFIDTYQRRGWYPKPLPFTPGLEGAGVVTSLGSDVKNFCVGDKVAFAHVPSSYADYAIAKATQLVRIPKELDEQTATALMLQGMTAHFLSHDTFPLTKEHTCLIYAAAGGVGRLLVQFAKARGALVIGVVSTPEKALLAKEAGADEVLITHDNPRVDAKVDIVYDSIGKDTFLQSLNFLKPRGLLVLYGQSSGPVEAFDPQLLNQKGSLFLTRPSLADYIPTHAALEARAQAVFTAYLQGHITPRIDKVFPLAEAADAHAYLEGRYSMGKVLLVP